MRYLLPIAPALCVFAAVEIAAIRFKAGKFAVAALILIVALWGTRDVLYQFTSSDPRDEAAVFLARKAVTPVTVGMANPPWYYAPPLSPQDSPPFLPLTPGRLFALSGNRYHFVFTGLNAANLQAAKPQWYVLSEFEWREKGRLQVPDYLKFREALEKDYELAGRFQNIAPGALPGRDFVPHDFLYPNLEIRVYRRK